MGNLFRSEDMHLLQLFIQAEAVHDTVEELGNLGLLEFEDLNAEVNAFNRNFVNDVRRCDEMLRKLRFFQEQVENEKIAIAPIDNVLQYSGTGGYVVSGTNATARMDDFEQRFTSLEDELLRMNANQDILEKSNMQMSELFHILDKTATFFDEAPNELAESTNDERGSLLGGTGASGGRAVKLGFVTGLIVRSQFAVFERLLWRATRGNLFMRHAEIEEPFQGPMGEEIKKNVFVIFFQGDRLQQLITKMCEAMGANLYNIPDNRADRERRMEEVKAKARELDTVMYRTSMQRRQVLERLASSLAYWLQVVNQEKAIFVTMNKFNFHVSRKALIAEGWAPVWADQEIQAALDRGRERSGTSIRSVFYPKSSKKSPPTYFMTNKFTVGFQTIVDTYGMAHYKEVNPGVFAIVTFPFLFGIMFGDIGHGIILTLFGLFLIVKEKQLEKSITSEIVMGIFGARYLLFAMGLMATYAGFIYNDIFALSVAVTDSNFVRIGQTQYFAWNPNGAYPFGIDPQWLGATNKMAFLNSIKMKLSIIIGVTQMGFGVILSLFNHLHFGRTIDVIFGTIPQIIFLATLFGYLVVLIIAKWCINWLYRPFSPPMLLTTLINMFLKFGSPLAETDAVYGGQATVQTVLTIVMVLTVPWMLCPKPYILLQRHKREVARLAARGNVETHPDEDEELTGGGHGGGHGEEGDEHEEFEFGEIVVHQIIHTIEYVLGTVSNTASYLRLWALSLAHAELSEVMYDQILSGQLVSGNVPLIFLAWGAWCIATIGILLIMECLSAFLHALRLHWVEFQSKFYVGDGRRFSPFDLKKAAAGADADE